uniref:glucan endo-1,3-beta-D-glucosidase n=1 Tax=Phaeomonas parva TaxID=124430 RepID=A0A7S1U813_9STRA
MGYGSVELPARPPRTVQVAEADGEQDAVHRRPAFRVFCAAWVALLLALSAVFTRQPQAAVPGRGELRGEAAAPVEGSAWPANPDPFSTVNPVDLGFQQALRDEVTAPGRIFGDVRHGAASGTPLPTNAWYQNLLMHDISGRFNAVENKANTIPYLLDTAVKDVGRAQGEDEDPTAGTTSNGLRIHYPNLLASATVVQLAYDEPAALQLGSAEAVKEQIVAASAPPNELSVTLEWAAEAVAGAVMRAPIVRGMAYVTMEYEMLSPLVSGQMVPAGAPLLDGRVPLKCSVDSQSRAPKAKAAGTAKEFVELHFMQSDYTWLVFLSEPARVACSQSPPDAENQFFRMQTLDAMRTGVVRVALANNCTTGTNPTHCAPDATGTGRDQTKHAALLRKHRTMYPTGDAKVQFTFPVRDSEVEDLTLAFDWAPRHMNSSMESLLKATPPAALHTLDDVVEPLMYALPHHMDDMVWTVGSSNAVSKFGCLRSIHGYSCPVSGGRWTMSNTVHGVSFSAPRSINRDMRAAIEQAVRDEIDYDVDENYRRGAGDTYFAGKQLAKLGRIIIIADEIGFDSRKVREAAQRLAKRAEIWLNGEAEAPLLFDGYWGGLVSCGCDFDEAAGACTNRYPVCPALTNAGNNFGHGYYNDHHFHYGYHIYAAAVASRFLPEWGKKHFEHVLAMIRDIANPSLSDKFFHTWRHKDWFLGSSWASGIAPIQGHPYPNGRNQESSSEAVASYEAVALYGSTMAEIFGGTPWGLPEIPANPKSATVAQKIRDLGRLLLSTEIRSAKRYWHVVQGKFDAPYDSIYPSEYQPYAVGMLWSIMAQFQTWFGSAPFLVYGIQMVPNTPTMELLLEPEWLEELLPDFKTSCDADPMCTEQGWKLLYFLAQAAVGNTTAAWAGLDEIPDAAYLTPGGNGHSRANSLYWIATRPLTPAEEH